MLETIHLTTTLVKQECCSCHMIFAVTTSFQKEMKDTHNSFCCPTGHWQSYASESETEKLQKIIDQKDNEIRIQRELKEEIWLDRNKIKNTLIAVKGHKTRIQKRIAAGVCPCCNRSFDNLHRHMNTKHPKYLTENK